jgi:hypothetical protein
VVGGLLSVLDMDYFLYCYFWPLRGSVCTGLLWALFVIFLIYDVQFSCVFEKKKDDVGKRADINDKG